MNSCPVLSNENYQKIIDKVGAIEFYRLWANAATEEDMPLAENVKPALTQVNYSLKIINALLNSKADNLFDRFFNTNKPKFYAELMNLGATKQQVQMLADFVNASETILTKDSLVASIVNQFLFPIEIKVAMKSIGQQIDEGELDPSALEYVNNDYNTSYPTQYYSNLTVPGGREGSYREVNIEVPFEIAIKGHAQFSTSGGIFWWRLDDKDIYIPTIVKHQGEQTVNEYKNSKISLGDRSNKTLRLLEYQSDIFQKGRENDDLVTKENQRKYDPILGYAVEPKVREDFKNSTQNQFLQLLNRDNNWASSGIKSLIQWVIKQGYEEIHLPTGDTAAKIEGHQTLEQFIEQRKKIIEDRKRMQLELSLELDYIDKAPYDFFVRPSITNATTNFSRIRRNNFGKHPIDLVNDSNYTGWVLQNYTVGENNPIVKISDKEAKRILEGNNIFKKEAFEENKERLKREQEQFEKELKDAQDGTLKISAIHSFYETTIYNILKKQGYNPERITDNYGSSWYSIKPRQEHANASFVQFNRIKNPENLEGAILQDLQKRGLININKEKHGGEEYYVVKRYEKNTFDPYKNSGQYSLYDNIKELQRLNDLYKQRNGWLPLTITQVDPNTYAVLVNKEGAIFNRTSDTEVATSKIKRIADDLSKRLGVDYVTIDSSTAEALLADVKQDYNGEPAFYLNGQVVFVENALSVNNVLHEFAHPFISALRKGNPELFNKLFKSLEDSNDRSIKDIFQAVDELYPELKDSPYRQEEIMVRVLSDIGQNKLSIDKKSFLKNLVDKILFYIKQLIRSISNKPVNLDSLSLHTTLQELSDLLYKDSQDIQLDNEKSDYVLWNREMAKEMSNIDNSLIIKNIATFRNAFQDGINKLKNNPNYNQLREVFKNEQDTSILHNSAALLKRAVEMENDATKQLRKLENFAQGVIGARIMSEKMRAHVDDLFNSSASERSKLQILQNYSYMINDWKEVFENLRQDSSEDLPLLSDEISKASKNFKRIEDYMDKIYKNGLVDVFRDQLAPLQKEAERIFPEQIAILQKAYNEGSKAVLKRLNKYKELYDKFNFTDEKILEFIRGEMGDTNWFSTVLESYTSSPDPIVGSFSVFVNKTLQHVESWTQQFKTELARDLDKDYKTWGVNRANPKQLGEATTYVDTLFTIEDNQPKGFKARVFLNEFANGWLFDYKNFEYKIEQAVTTGDKQAEIDLRKEFAIEKEKYWNREYLDQVYEVKKYWTSTPIAEKAHSKRKIITDELRDFENYADALTVEEVDRVKELQHQLQTLGSTKNLDGSDKQGEDLEIAEAIKKYYELSKGIYTEYEKKGSFDLAHQELRANLIDEGLKEDDPEYIKRESDWLKDNLRITNSQLFYDSRQGIIDEIKTITDKLPTDEAKKLDISKVWTDIIDQVKGFRDSNGQPVGSEMSEEKIAQVKKDQEKINDIQEQLRRMNGLNQEEQAQLSDYYSLINSGYQLGTDDQNTFNELVNRRNIGLTKADKARLLSLMEQLRDFQSKIPTEYYLDTLNERLIQGNVNQHIGYDNIDTFLLESSLATLLERDDTLSRWIKDNHIRKTRWNPDTKTNDIIYERLYVWNRIIPNNAKLKEALTKNDYRKALEIDSPYVSVKKASKYYFYRVKDELRTKKEVGKTVDNRGNWLPKTKEQAKTPEQLKLSEKYRNEEYYRLKESTNSKDQALYRILETYKKYHLKAQENSPKYGRLWLEIPRRRREKLENVNNVLDDPKAAYKSSIDYVKDRLSFKQRPDDFETGNAGDPDVSKIYVMTDLAGNERTSIPVSHMSKLSIDDVSYDIFSNVVKYASSINTVKALHDINPIARALQTTLQSEGIKNVNKTSKLNILGLNVSVKEKGNNRLKAIDNFIQREFEGVENHMELGIFGQRIAQHLMGLAAFGSLALNIPAGVKNMAVARIQNMLEAITGHNFDGPEWIKASGLFVSKYLPNMVRDYNTFANKSLYTQIHELFDPVEGRFSKHLGKEGTATYRSDIINLKFTHSAQELGETEAQGTAALAMRLHERVPIVENGVSRLIPYEDAWILRDGVIALKDGIDPSWGPGGDNFLAHKLKMQKVNELLQGAYSRFNQPEMNRYTSLRMVSFMRRFFIPSVVNRFAPTRPNIALGTFREGYYQTWWKVSREMVQSGMKNWHLMSTAEKRGFWRTMAELGYSMIFLALLSLVGFDTSDPDRFKKLKKNGWALNMLIYEILLIKGETETFLPLPGFGADELARMKDNPSVAFPLLNKYLKLLNHLIQHIRQPFTDDDVTHFKQDSGIYKKGDLKIMADLLKIIGYTGATLNPDVAVKNYSMLQNKYQ